MPLQIGKMVNRQNGFFAKLKTDKMLSLPNGESNQMPTAAFTIWPL